MNTPLSSRTLFPHHFNSQAHRRPPSFQGILAFPLRPHQFWYRFLSRHPLSSMSDEMMTERWAFRLCHVIHVPPAFAPCAGLVSLLEGKGAQSQSFWKYIRRACLQAAVFGAVIAFGGYAWAGADKRLGHRKAWKGDHSLICLSCSASLVLFRLFLLSC